MRRGALGDRRGPAIEAQREWVGRGTRAECSGFVSHGLLEFRRIVISGHCIDCVNMYMFGVFRMKTMLSEAAVAEMEGAFNTRHANILVAKAFNLST